MTAPRKTRSGAASRRASFKPFPPTIARSVRRRRGQDRPQGENLVPLGAQRHSRRRGSAAAPVFRGRLQGRITLPEFVALTATNHAKMYGLYPRKGSIMVGADADIAIWDPGKHVVLTQELMQHGSDYTPYEGIEVMGWPVTTLVRGALVADAGRVWRSPASANSWRVRQLRRGRQSTWSHEGSDRPLGFSSTRSEVTDS